ncbi:MAG TPA: Rpn family recombination-promoting nuclease/putative transposase [Thermoanaerobaculia bacterium]|nr:Rpn family recombination-promoting nuclease/putative transposase [Thermoanaerobaculia bacterium]
MAGNDPKYRLLFSHPRMVEDLLRGFIHENWVAWLDFGTLERVNGSFVSEDLKDRRNDVVWRLRWRDERNEEDWFYLYLLLEFQSTPEPFMAVRLFVYVGLLLQELIRAQKLKATDRLPPILPVVLYNGKRPWKAPLDLLSLFASAPESLRRRLPRLEYILVDESRLSPEDREQAGNLVSVLARLETSHDAEELSRSTRELVRLLPKGEESDLRRIFTAWALQALRRTHRGATIPEVEELEEVPMLEERIRDWERKARREGRIEGARRMVLRLLERRFGPVPRRIRERVNAIASLRELDDLADKIFIVGSLQAMGLDG